MSSHEPKVVEPCKGWDYPCTFCGKRFSDWKEPEEEILSNDALATPGVFMFAFESKQGKEIVAIGSHPTNILKAIQQKLPSLKQQTSQKKHKESKSTILLRFINSQNEDSKESCSLFAHWNNYGILPRLNTQWPGLDALKSTEHYQFNELMKKWCHPTKDPFWRKQKVNLAPKAIKPCKGWKEACSFCDARFTTWVPYKESLDMAPSQPGLLMFSDNQNSFREILFLDTCPSLRNHIASSYNAVEYYFRYCAKPTAKLVESKYGDIEVRWLVVEDLENEDSCLVYAHWINQKTKPQVNAEGRYRDSKLPGEEALSKSEHFSFRRKDKQWCYEENEPQKSTAGFSKNREKRHMMQSMRDDLVTNA